MTRLRHLGAGLGALAALAALLGGIPWALWHYIGWPLPHAVPTLAQLNAGLTANGIPDPVLLKALSVVVWVGWAVLAASILAEVAASIRGTAARRVPLAGPLQPIAGHLVAAVAIALLSTVPRPPATPPGPLTAKLGSPPAPIAVALTADHVAASSNAPTLTATPTLTAAPPPPRADPAQLPASGNQPTSGNGPRPYVVGRRDTLWGIAQARLGDPLRWREIYALNQGRPQPDGQTLTDPNRIWPGWTLLLPATPAPAPEPGESAPTAPAATPSIPRTPPPASPTPAQPRPAATPSPPPASPAKPPAPPTSTADDAHPADASAPDSAVWVELASGSRLGASFAAGVLAAVGAGRLRRRHAYRPQPPKPASTDPPPSPPALRDLLLATHGDRTNHDDDDEPAGKQPGWAPKSAHPPTAPIIAAAPDPDDRARRPDLVEVGTRHGEVMRLPLAGWAGLALAGEGADGAARAWLAALITRAGPYGAQITGPAAVLDRLLPGVPALPALRPVTDLTATLDRLEAELVARSRRLADADAPDAAAYRARCPEDPLPAVLAVVDTVPHALLGRWRAVLDAATPLGIDALLVGDATGEQTAAGAGVVVNADGQVVASHPEALTGLLGGARLFALGAAEAVDLLRPVAAAHNDDTLSPAPACDEDRPADGPPHPDPPAAAPGHPGPAGTDRRDDRGGGPGASRPDAAGSDRWRPPQEAPDGVAPVTVAPVTVAPVTVAPVTVQLLGPLRIWAGGTEVVSGLRSSARQVLAWYLLHPEGASAEAAIDACWPAAAPDQGRQRFWNALGSLRSRLRGTGPDGENTEVMVKAGEWYRPRAGLVEVDLWRFQAALAAAAAATDTAGAISALQCAVAAYGGDLVDGADYLWAEPVREDLHRRCLDAHVRLAELQADTGMPEAAIETLEHALCLDPLAEDLYRRLIVLQGALGRPDAARRTWRLLSRRLGELDVEPEPGTATAYRQAIATPTDPAPTQTAAGSPPPPGAADRLARRR